MPFDITPYVPTEDDLEVANNWLYHCRDDELPDNDEASLIRLIKGIRGFDYYYNYSDDGNVYRVWSKVEAAIKAKLVKLEETDPELAKTLKDHFNPERADDLYLLYPWLLQPYSRYGILINRDSYSPEEACELIAITDWIKQLTTSVRVNQNYNTEVVSWSSDYPTANRLLRDRFNSIPVVDIFNNEVLSPVTVSDALLTDLGKLATILETRGYFTKLRNPALLDNHRLHVQYVNGFTVYDVCGVYLMV